MKPESEKFDVAAEIKEFKKIFEESELNESNITKYQGHYNKLRGHFKKSASELAQSLLSRYKDDPKHWLTGNVTTSHLTTRQACQELQDNFLLRKEEDTFHQAFQDVLAAGRKTPECAPLREFCQRFAAHELAQAIGDFENKQKVFLAKKAEQEKLQKTQELAQQEKAQIALQEQKRSAEEHQRKLELEKVAKEKEEAVQKTLELQLQIAQLQAKNSEKSAETQPQMQELLTTMKQIVADNQDLKKMNQSLIAEAAEKDKKIFSLSQLLSRKDIVTDTNSSAATTLFNTAKNKDFISASNALGGDAQAKLLFEKATLWNKKETQNTQKESLVTEMMEMVEKGIRDVVDIKEKNKCILFWKKVFKETEDREESDCYFPAVQPVYLAIKVLESKIIIERGAQSQLLENTQKTKTNAMGQ